MWADAKIQEGGEERDSAKAGERFQHHKNLQTTPLKALKPLQGDVAAASEEGMAAIHGQRSGEVGRRETCLAGEEALVPDVWELVWDQLSIMELARVAGRC